MSSAADMGDHPPVTPEETVNSLPLLTETEQQIRDDAPAALRYLNKTNNNDLATILGLEGLGEN
jgi:hypothetical protein